MVLYVLCFCCAHVYFRCYCVMLMYDIVKQHVNVFMPIVAMLK